MAYQQCVDNEHPACIVFLIDQSFSMSELATRSPGSSKAQVVTEVVNNLTHDLVMRSIKGPNLGLHHYYDLAVIGYGERVELAWCGRLAGRRLVSIVEIANHPLRIVDRADGTRFPIWFEEVSNGPTPMLGALDTAGRITADWVTEHPRSFPPIIINLSDGAATDGDPRLGTQHLTSLATRDGQALVFNVILSDAEHEPFWFPNSPIGLISQHAQTMFDISDELPGFMQEQVTTEGRLATSQTRGFVLDTDITSLVTFLQIATSTPHLDVDRSGASPP